MADFEQRLAMESRPGLFSELELEELQRLTFEIRVNRTARCGKQIRAGIRLLQPSVNQKALNALAAFQAYAARTLLVLDLIGTLSSLQAVGGRSQGTS